MPRLGVLGWPVAHSRSPAIHNAALAASGLSDWRYQLLPVPPQLLAVTVRGLAGSGFAGANVTIPHKRAALALADRASPAATEIGAANTLSLSPDGSIEAENTDAPGLIAALDRSPAGMRALVLGAGGSARAAAWALREAGAGEVLVWNRTAARARELARDLGVRAVERPEPADFLINCTSVGLSGLSGGPATAAAAEAPQGLQRSATGDGALNQLGLTLDLLGEYSYVVDLVYRDGPTELLAAARARGVPTLDGLAVLVAQAALSFERWTGRPAPLEVMRRAAQDGTNAG